MAGCPIPLSVSASPPLCLVCVLWRMPTAFPPTRSPACRAVPCVALPWLALASLAALENLMATDQTRGAG
jgi:ABC-type transport system involved in cytochrome c biogenesis permease component